MCPTLEQILSRSLMRGKLPINRPSVSSAASSGSAGIPSLKVPQAKPASIHRATSTATEESPKTQSNNNKTTPTSYNQDSVISAFSSLSKPQFKPDSRVKILERPERGGLRSLQDLPSLLHSAVVLDEWKSALQALDEAVDLVVKDCENQQQQSKNAKNSSLLAHSIRKNISIEHFAAAAKVCDSNQVNEAFEKFMNDKMNELTTNMKNQQQEQQDREEEDSTASILTIKEEMTDLTTEAFCQAGNWNSALKFYEKLGKGEEDRRQTIGSLNACISACSAKRSLWETAIKLAMPAIEAREKELVESQILQDNLLESEGKSQDKRNDEETEKEDPTTSTSSASSSAEPLSHFGTDGVGNTNSSSSSNNNSSVVANAITYASLVSTLENCGRSVEASKILKSAPPAEREAVLTSYVALLQVWSENHGKKSMRRF